MDVAVNDLVARADVLRSEFRSLSLSPSRFNAHRARDVIEDFNDVRLQLSTYNRLIKPIY